jgi:succinoglycan biosynthesis transport protein ExoP
MQPWDLAVYSLHLFRRWWLLVLLTSLISGATVFYLMRSTPAQYVAHMTLMVGTNLRSKSPNEEADRLSMTLAAFYAEMARRTPITGPVVERLKLPFSAEVLNQQLVSARVIPQAQLIELSVLDIDPRRAAHIANAIAEELIDFSPTAPEDLEALRRSIQAQLSDLEDKIRHTEQRIRELNTAIQKMTSAGEIAEAQQRLRELEALKSADQASYGSLLSSQESTAVNTLSVFEPAVPPTTALPRRTMPLVTLGALLGFVIGLAGAWVLETVDNVWSYGRRPELVVGAPAVGPIPTGWGWDRLGIKNWLATVRGQQCLAVRSEVLVQLPPTAHPTLMITSAYTSLERSRLSLDLARLFAYSGQHVLLVDANLGTGYTTVALGGHGDGVQRLLREPKYAVAELIEPTDQPELVLLPSGLDNQHVALVPTLNWSQAIDAIKGYSAELTLFDGPPVLGNADAMLLAPRMDGVVLVIDPATERCSDTRQAIERLRAAQAPLVGTVLLTSEPEHRPFWHRLRSMLPIQKPIEA